MPARAKNLNHQTSADGAYFKGRATEAKGRAFHSFIDGGNKEEINNSKPILAISIDHEVIMGQNDSFEVLSKNSFISNLSPKEQSAIDNCCGGVGCCGGQKKVVKKSAFAKGEKYGSKYSISEDSSSMLSDDASS